MPRSKFELDVQRFSSSVIGHDQTVDWPSDDPRSSDCGADVRLNCLGRAAYCSASGSTQDANYHRLLAPAGEWRARARVGRVAPLLGDGERNAGGHDAMRLMKHESHELARASDSAPVWIPCCRIGALLIVAFFSAAAGAERAYVPNEGSGTVTVIDTAADQVGADSPIPRQGSMGEKLCGIAVTK